jgi:hypothetical protein
MRHQCAQAPEGLWVGCLGGEWGLRWPPPSMSWPAVQLLGLRWARQAARGRHGRARCAHEVAQQLCAATGHISYVLGMASGGATAKMGGVVSLKGGRAAPRQIGSISSDQAAAMPKLDGCVGRHAVCGTPAACSRTQCRSPAQLRTTPVVHARWGGCIASKRASRARGVVP